MGINIVVSDTWADGTDQIVIEQAIRKLGYTVTVSS